LIDVSPATSTIQELEKFENTLEVITDGQTIQWPKKYLRDNY
jgi:hypothetical protein